MKTKILALGFSLAFLLGNAVYGGQGKDHDGPIHTLEPYVVTPHMVKLLNDQKLKPVDFEAIIRKAVDEAIEQHRLVYTKTLIAFQLKVIEDVPLVAAAK